MQMKREFSYARISHDAVKLSEELLLFKGFPRSLTNLFFLTSSYHLYTMWCRQRQWRNEKIMRECLRYCCCLMPNPFGKSNPSEGKKIHSLTVFVCKSESQYFCLSGDCDPFVWCVPSLSSEKRSFGKFLSGGNFFMVFAEVFYDEFFLLQACHFL